MMRSTKLSIGVVLGSLLLVAPAARAAELPPGVTQAWLDRVQQDLAAQAYRFETARDGSASAPNAAHGLATRVAPAGIAVDPSADAAGARLELSLVRFGREGDLRDVPAGVVASHGQRAEIRRDALGLVEWYENAAQGLEQGWTLAARPASEPAGRPLVLELATLGKLRPELLPGEQRIAFVDASGAPRLHYGKLVALDALGAELPADLVVVDERIQIRVDDRDAAYPVVIDPLLTTASWDPESDLSGASFGASVSTAGDFNGDGFSDVIVGAPSLNVQRGRVFLFLGGPGGPDEIADATFDGNGGFDHFGAAVAAAGNVNNDAFDDVVVGAPGDAFLSLDNFAGRIAVFLGNAGGTLSNPTSAANCFNSNPAGREGLGGSVAGAGDVNGDGFDDVIAGGPELVIDLNRSGIVCVYPGSGSGILTAPASVVGINASSGITATIFQSQGFGNSVSGAGDVNGDGFADIVVGAPGARGIAGLSVGAAYVFHGPLVDGDGPEFAQLGDNRTAFPVGSTASFGAAVADAGDLNGDGFADIIVGAPDVDQSATIGGDNRGGVFLFQGSASGIVAAVPDCDPSDFFTNVPAQFCETGAAANARMGGQVTSAGDLNGDGFADAMFSQSGFGTTHVVFGNASAGYFHIAGPSLAGLNALGNAGDTDGDGFNEVLLGDQSFSNGQTGEGRVLMFRGTGDMPLALPTPVSFSFEANQPGANLGLGVSAGDINADGFTDIVTGWPGYDGCGLIFDPDVDEGTIQVSYGGSCGPACGPSFFPGFCVYEGNEDGANVGAAVSATGDVNGDGFADVLVGAPGHSAAFFPFPALAGRAYLYLGASSGLAGTAAATIYGLEGSAQLGLAVSIVGDVNGDGRADAMIGEPNSNEVTGAGAGSAHLYYGTPTGLTASPVWSGIGTGLYAQYGSAIAGAGDVNRDGYADVVIGAPGTNNSTGEAYVYLGGAQGLGTTAFRTYVGEAVGAELGSAVGSGGDVNGDGISEVLVGSPGISRVMIDLNGGQGFLTGPGGSRFGGAVGSAGDVNGDGFNDLAIGAHWEDAGAGFAQGRVHLFLGPSITFTPARTYADCPHSFCDYGVRLPGPADVNGDGFSDLVTTAFKFTNGEQDEGGVFVRFGNGVDGFERVPQQLTDNSVPIQPVGTSPNPAFFRVRANGRSPAGRTSVRLVAEAKALASPFDALGLTSTAFADSGVGAPGVLLNGVATCANATCKWRARVRSRNPHFPGSPWLSPPENARTEADLQHFADFEGDGVRNADDTCPTITNTLLDTDMDGVDQACDTCSLLANPKFMGTLTNRTRVSGQLDDDADGRGNRCDFDYNNAGPVLTASDFNDMKFSLIPSPGLMSASNCGATAAEGGSGAAQRCGEFDHDGAGPTVTATDFNLCKAAVAAGGVINTNFPKCTECSVGTGWSNALGTGGERAGRPVCESAVPGACTYAP